MSYYGQLIIVPDVTMKLAKQINNLGRDTPGGPGSHCDFKINEDGDTLKHDGSEKTRDDAEWIKYIVQLLQNNGHRMNGIIEVTDGEYGDIPSYDIVVEDNVVYLQEYETVKKPSRTRV